MNALKKQLGVLLVFVVGIVIATMKGMLIVMLKRLLAFGIVASVLAMLHLASDKDSTAVATRPHPKPQHQVAQGNGQKPNPADKLAGPVAPAPSGSAVTPSAPLGAGAIQAARNAAAAQNAQLAKETGQAVPTPKGAPTQTAAATPKPSAPSPATPATPHPVPSQGTQVVQQGSAKPAANTNVDAPVMRESFDYTRDARRDPFVSLMTTSDLRPTLTDLRLTGILYDLSGRRPVAILRDIAGGQWRVTTGMTLGRMRVAQIKPKTIIFTIEEFGFNRQDSLILGDTTRVRHR